MDNDRAVTKRTLALRVVGMAFVVMGLCPVWALIVFDVSHKPMLLPIFMIAGGAIFMAVGIMTAAGVFAPRPIVFDRNRGEITVQEKVFRAAPQIYSLSRLVAVQVCRLPQPRYTIYELNLVLAGPVERITVLNYSDYSRFRVEAESLAKFLDVPVIEESPSK